MLGDACWVEDLNLTINSEPNLITLSCIHSSDGRLGPCQSEYPAQVCPAEAVSAWQRALRSAPDC